MKKILVTGASGFIGNYVIAELLKNNCAVIATSSNPEKAAQLSWLSKVTYLPFDFKSFDPNINYQQHFGHPDAVIHLAWEGLPNYKAAFHLEENLPRHQAFLKNLIGHGNKDITITGTCFEYGLQEGCLTEQHPAKPATIYATAKNELHQFLLAEQQLQPFELKWIRLFYMFGAGQGTNSLLSQIDKTLLNGDESFNMSGGEQLRDYLPVEQVATHIVRIALQHSVTGVINCCSGVPISIRQLVENYLAEKKRTIHLNLGYYPYSDYEPMRFWGDNTKLKSL